MEMPYRQSLIQMLCPECTYIKTQVEELRQEIRELNLALYKRAKLHIHWIGGFSSFLLFVALSCMSVPTLAALVAAFFPITLAHLIIPTRFTKAFIGYVSRRPEFQKLHESIEERGQRINELTHKATTYQEKLEPKGAPGLLAIYSDVLNKPYFNCPVRRSERKLATTKSVEGRGQEIDIYHYGAILKSLKSFDFNRYLNSKTIIGIDFLRAGSRSAIAIQCSYLIANHALGNVKPSTSTVHQAMIVGTNAFNSVSKSGVPGTWTAPKAKLFLCAGRFLDSLNKTHIDTEALAREYLGLFRKAVSHDKTIAAFVPDIPEVA